MFTRAAGLAEKAIGSQDVPITPGYNRHETEKMIAVVWHGKQDVRVEEVGRPVITDPKDVIIKVTGSTVCGSDLHLYHGEIPDLRTGEVLGHEGIGIVAEVGPEVKNFKIGDRVVSPFSIGCGECWYCTRDLPSMCSMTNKSTMQNYLWGDRIGSVIGYSHFLGGLDGAQASWLRIPYADTNAFKVDDSLPDEKALYLSDICCTSYHACKVLQMHERDCTQEVVGIWGAGPIGLHLVQWCLKVFKVKKVFLMDPVQNRLDWAKKIWPEVEIVNPNDVKSVPEYLHEHSEKQIGIDIAFDAAGFRYSQGLLHKALRAVALETDTPETLNEIILSLRKFGSVSIPADYAGLTNGFNIGALMEKGLRMIGTGQAPARAVMPEVQKHMLEGNFDPTTILTHRFKFEDFSKAYAAFDQKVYDEKNQKPLIKCFIETPFSTPRKCGPELSEVPGV